MPTTNFMIQGPIEKKDSRPGQSVKKSGTLNSGSRYVILLAPCFTWHNLRLNNMPFAV